MNDEILEVLEQYCIGQNADEYFIMVKDVEDDEVTSTTFQMTPKKIKDLKKTGEADIETMDGRKHLDILEYTTETNGALTQVKAYVDPSNELVYRIELKLLGFTMIEDLTEYILKWQTSYKESKSIGKTYEYECKMEGFVFDAKITCVADCLDDQYGVVYDFTLFGGGKAYFLSDDPQGLPTDAEDTGETTTLSILDEEVSVEKWKYTDAGSEIVFYYEPNTHVIYRFVVSSAIIELVFDLTKKPV
ncbi:MAG: hypothetical protein LBP82_00330, partial [Candidatus Methanoplasma sp.]|jgi:hypothetical protein|nr:hypothetical protein [Candidatus Methanoplasma sp.]